jgi:hypothetical protein
MDKIIKFNNILDSFVKFVIDSNRDNQEIYKKIRIFEAQISLAKTFSDTFLYEAFKIYVLPYKKQIYACDGNFFINEFDNIMQKVSKESIEDAKIFKDMWGNNDRKFQATIFQYFIKMVKIL